MFNKDPTDQAKKDQLPSQSKSPISVFAQNQVPIDQSKQNAQPPSNTLNPSQNTQGAKQISIGKPKIQITNKQQKQKQTVSQQNKNKTNKNQGSGGGVLRQGGQQDQKKESLAIDTTLHYGLQDIIDAMVQGKTLDGRQIDKVVNNFKNFVKSDVKSFSLDKITQQDSKIPSKPKILKLPYLSQIEDKSKITINQFWVSLIQNICQKIPFMNQQACLQIIKLEISMNKDVYCQKGNIGNFNVQVFATPHLFPIINNKIQINTQHQLYIRIKNQIMHLILNLFKAFQGIFKQMTSLKIKQVSKYNRIFQYLEKNNSKKKQILKNLFDSFFVILKFTSQQKLTSNLPYLQSIAESIWYFYSSNQNVFETEICKNFLNKLNQNYSFFNKSGKHQSSNLKKFLDCVQKITISFLLSHPFDFKKWEGLQLKTTILESNLEMLEPFKMILPKNRREERKMRVCSYQTKGFHWKEFIEIMIKLEQDDEETMQFIIECIRSFLGQNYEIFWEEPLQFESFFRFTRRLLSQKSNQFNEEQMRDRFLQIMGIASKLMGGEKQKSDQKGYSIDIGEVYPETKILPFSLRVYNEFSEYFMGMNKKEFMEVIEAQVVRMVQESRENGTDKYDSDKQMNLRREYLLKEYILKLISSEPSLFLSMFKIDSRIKQEQLLKFFILQTITNSSLPSNIIDFAFAALDRMLIHPTTCKLIENILSLDGIEGQLNWSVNSLFQNIKALPFIARHCGVLIDLNYQQQQWTRQLLEIFYEFSMQEGRKLFDINSVFAKSYYQLFSGILSRLNTKEIRNINSFRPYINISFVIDSLKYYLKFDFHRGEYVNITVCEQNPAKIQSLLECVRLYNIILTYQLKIQSINLEDKSLINTANISTPGNRLLSAFEAKQLGVDEKQYNLQVRSVRNETTSYLNALSFILVSSNDEQKRILKEINSDYESLIFETIQTLAKLNDKTNLRFQFQINNPYKSTLGQNIGQFKEDRWCLKKFISYVESSLNESGIQVIIFGDLIQKPEILRALIDKVRVKMQNPRIRDRMSYKLILKVISTLARYFRDSMARMSLHKDKELNFNSLQIRDHFQYLLQIIANSIVGFKGTTQHWQQTIISNILKNLYGGFLTVQSFNSSQFLKLLKNFHPILLNSINLNYLLNTSFMNNMGSHAFEDQIEIRNESSMVFNEDYFKLLQLFFNCEQYLSSKQFNIIQGIKQLPTRLQNFILAIAKYTQFSKLPQDFVNILLQILVSGVSFFISISNSQQEKLGFLSEFYDFILSQKHQIKPSVNFILLQLLVFNQLSITYHQKDLFLQNQQILPLQMISISQELPLQILQQIISNLKKPNLNNIAFLSIANGLFSNIQHSSDSTPLLKPLLEVYNQIIKTPQSYPTSFSNASLHSRSQSDQIWKQKNWNSPYKKIWALQLILTILTNIQANPTFQKTQIQKQFQNLLIQNDGILKRFGIIMKKIALQESEIYMPWLSFLEEQISYQLSDRNQVTFVQKLELYQIMKIFSFLFANTDWHSSFLNKYVELISILVQYPKVFEKLCFSNKKHKGQTTQEKILESISLNNLLSTQQVITSGLNQFDKQKISGEVLKSSNSFQLLHEAINFDLSLQYSLMCTSIGISFCEGLSRKSPQLADLSKWNNLFLQFTQTLVQKYIQIINNQPLLQKILSQFSEIYNGNSQYNINLSKQMLFTNSPSLSSCLDVSYNSWKEILIETLSLLFENIYTINRKLQTELHSQFKSQQQKFISIVSSLKKHDKQNFDYGLYDPTEQKNKMNQTIRSNLTLNIHNSQIHPNSALIRNY